MITRNSARVLGLDRVGTIAPGKSADFIVLDANPIDDINNTRRIDAVTCGERPLVARRCAGNGPDGW